MTDIGFYFMIFQSQLNGYIKCYIDGDDSYVLYSVSDFLDLASKLRSESLNNLLKDCISTTSFFVWDVMNSSVKRMKPLPYNVPLREEMNKLNPMRKQEKPLIESIKI